MSVAAGVPPAFWVAVACVFGLVVGSFLNVVIHRLPRGESIVRPRSRCPACGRPVAALENVPVLSWLWLRGRCAGCRGPISPRYPAIELLTGLAFAAVAARWGAAPMTPVLCAFAAALIAAAAIDFDHHIIPDEISLGGLVVALAIVPWARSVDGGAWLDEALRSVAGAALGAGLLWSVGFAHARAAAAMGRRFEHWPGDGEDFPRPGQADFWLWFPGMGLGDVKLLAMIGAVLGPIGVVETIVVASVAGLLVGLAWALVRRSFAAPFGFGPAIAVGALFVALVPHAMLFVL